MPRRCRCCRFCRVTFHRGVGYNRNLTVSNNEFSFIGDGAMASWGDTSAALNANGSLTVPGAGRSKRQSLPAAVDGPRDSYNYILKMPENKS